MTTARRKKERTNKTKIGRKKKKEENTENMKKDKKEKKNKKKTDETTLPDPTLSKTSFDGLSTSLEPLPIESRNPETVQPNSSTILFTAYNLT